MALIQSLALFASLALGQSGSFSVGCFNGLNDTDSPATISDCDAQAALNVEPNKAGTAIKKRKGYAREGALTVTTAPVTGSHSFLTDAGDRLVVVCNDHLCSKSVNGGSFSVFVDSATLGVTRWSLLDVDGDLYMANDQRDEVLKYNGTAVVDSTSVPKGTILEMTQDRLVVADQSASPNRLCYSASGSFEDFVTGIYEYSAWCDDLGSPGDRITGLKYDAGILYVFKSNSINACEVGNQYTTKCTVLANYVGTKDPASIISTPYGVMFKGDDGFFWLISQGRLSNVSQNISTLIKTQPSGSQRNNTTNSSTDWDLGTEVPAGSWDSYTIPGSIFPTSTTLLDNSSTTWQTGTLSEMAITPDGASIKLSSVVYQDDFSDGDYTSGPATWTVTSGVFSVGAGWLFGASHGNGDYNSAYSMMGRSSGSWTFEYKYYDTTADPNTCSWYEQSTTCMRFKFQQASPAGDYYALRIRNIATRSEDIELIKSVGGTVTILSSYNTILDSVRPYQFRIEKASATAPVYVYLDDVFISSANDKSVTASGIVTFTASDYYANPGGWIVNYITNVYISGYKDPGLYTSPIMDTGYLAPVGGVFHATFTANGVDDAVSFSLRSSTASDNSGWTAWTATSDTVHIPSVRRYWQYKGQFDTNTATMTPVFYGASLSAATTGQYTSQCIQTGGNVSAWGMLSCSETKSAGGSLTYYVSTGATCAATLTDYYTAQTNNTAISVATAPAMSFRFTSLLNSATDQAQVDACTVYWNEGSVAPPTWGVYDSANDAAYWAIASGTSTTNNRFLRLDLGLKSWSPWDLSATAPIMRDHNLYFGDSVGGYWNKYGGVDNDNGAAVNSYWKSKDWGAGSPFTEKGWTAISSVLRNQQTGSLSITHTDSNGEAGTYSVNLDTDSAKAYIRNNENLKLLTPSTFLNVEFGNNALNQPWELDGYRIDFKGDSWRPLEQ